jgi:hypothetical protein
LAARPFAQGFAGFGLTGETGMTARLLPGDRLKPFALLLSRFTFGGTGGRRRAPPRALLPR